MAIILETRFQFPHCVMKNVLFPKAITIFILIYLFWFKMEQTLDLALLASRRLPFRHVFSASFRELCYLDCKTVRIFAYSSTHEHAKQKVWNEAENRERYGRVRLARFARIRLLLHAFCSLCATWLRRFLLQSKTLWTPHNGKTIRSRPGYTPKFTKKKGWSNKVTKIIR